MSVEITNMSSGEHLGVSVIEIASIPSRSILPTPQAGSVETLFKNDFARLLGEIHHVAFNMVPGEARIGDISFEITWVTTPVENQLYTAKISIYLLIRVICNTEQNARSYTAAIEKNLKTMLINQRYDFVDVRFSDYCRLTSAEMAKTVALTKHERLESAGMMNAPPLYSYGKIPESDLDLSGLACVMAYCPNSVVRIQLIPTVFDEYENGCIFDFVTRATNAVKGVIITPGQPPVSLPQYEHPLETYNYYARQKTAPLFRYNFVASGSVESLGSITSQLQSQLSSDPNDPIRFDMVDLPGTLFSGDSAFFSPWLTSQQIYASFVQSTNLIIGNVAIDPRSRRLPMVITATEACEVCRLPIGSETVRSGFVVNESRKDSKVYRDNLLNSSDLEMGHLRSSMGDMIGLSLGDMTKHMFICGTSGSGKSSFSVGVLDRMWNDHHIPFLVIEPAKTEYRSLIRSIPDLQIFTPGKNQLSPFMFNPFQPPKNVKLGSYKSTLKTAFSAAVSMASPLDKIFEETINNSYSEHRWLDTYAAGDGGTAFNITEFIKCFQDTFEAIGYVGESKNIGRAGLVRLAGLVNLFDNYNSIPIEDILSKPTVIELAAIENPEQKSLMIALILLSILSYINANYEGNGGLRNILLLEEAHVLLDQELNGQSDANPGPLAQSLVKRMLAEARSYGLGMMIADQSPRKVGLDIVALTDIKITFRVVEGSDKQIIGDSMGMDDVQLSRLSKLRPGNAFIFFNKLDAPEEIIIDDYRRDGRIPVWIGDDEVRKKSTYWLLNKANLRPYPECEIPVFCKETCDLNRRTLAREVSQRIVKKHLGGAKDINKLKYVVSNLPSLIKSELNHEEYDEGLFSCVKVHFWRSVMYSSEYRFSKEQVNDYILNR